MRYDELSKKEQFLVDKLEMVWNTSRNTKTEFITALAFLINKYKGVIK